MSGASSNCTQRRTFSAEAMKSEAVACLRVLLDEILRGLGKEIVFQCPSCDRRCTRLAFRSYGLVCARCGPVTWGSNREGKIARMVRRANTIADKLGLQSWANKPTKKPANMRLARYVSLLDLR